MLLSLFSIIFNSLIAIIQYIGHQTVFSSSRCSTSQTQVEQTNSWKI